MKVLEGIIDGIVVEQGTALQQVRAHNTYDKMKQSFVDEDQKTGIKLNTIRMLRLENRLNGI